MSTMRQRFQAIYPPAMYGVLLGMLAHGSIGRLPGEVAGLILLAGSVFAGLVCVYRRKTPGPAGNPFYYYSDGGKVFVYSIIALSFSGLGMTVGFLATHAL